MKVLDFFNVKTKKKFRTSKYVIKVRNNRRYAVAKNAGIECWRAVGRK